MNATSANTTDPTASTGASSTDVMADVTTITSTAEVPILIIQKLSGDIPEFQIILPCIFGVFMILALGLIVFYTKSPDSKGAVVSPKRKTQGRFEPNGVVRQ